MDSIVEARTHLSPAESKRLRAAAVAIGLPVAAYIRVAINKAHPEASWAEEGTVSLRTQEIRFRMEESDLARVKKEAAAIGLSVAAFARMCILTRVAPVPTRRKKRETPTTKALANLAETDTERDVTAPNDPMMPV